MAAAVARRLSPRGRCFSVKLLHRTVVASDHQVDASNNRRELLASVIWRQPRCLGTLHRRRRRPRRSRAGLQERRRHPRRQRPKSHRRAQQPRRGHALQRHADRPTSGRPQRGGLRGATEPCPPPAPAIPMSPVRAQPRGLARRLPPGGCAASSGTSARITVATNALARGRRSLDEDGSQAAAHPTNGDEGRHTEVADAASGGRTRPARRAGWQRRQ